MRLLLAVSAERNNVVERILIFGWKNLRLFTNTTKLAMKTNAPRSGSEIASIGMSLVETRIPLHSQNLGRTAILLFLTLACPHSRCFGNLDGAFLTFVKPSGTDGHCLRIRIASRGCLADAHLTMGLFNAAQETTYARYSSPIGTEWAYGTLANYSSLTYTNWEGWNGHNPPSMVGKDACCT